MKLKEVRSRALICRDGAGDQIASLASALRVWVGSGTWKVGMLAGFVRTFLTAELLALLIVAGVCARANFEAPGVASDSRVATAVVRTWMQSAAHDVGKLVLTVSNSGKFGSYGSSGIDAFTGLAVPACEFPKGSGSRYLFAGLFWIGAVVGRDTLVSTGADGWSPPMFELYPDAPPYGRMIKRSSDQNDAHYNPNAVSDQDYVAVYTDTFTTSGDGVQLDPDGITKGPHKPLGIEITQKSYAWAYPYAEDFILFDYRIKNIWDYNLHDVYMGIYVDGDVYGPLTDGPMGAQDDENGFVQALPAPKEFSGNCSFMDTVNLAFIYDNDGDPFASYLHAYSSCPNVTGLAIMRTPTESLKVSYNWWIPNFGDFGPQTRAMYRPMGPAGGLGTPVGDVNKYHLLRNGEIDYDQIRTGQISATDSIWMPPPADIAVSVPLGADTRYLLSFGPFDIAPGQELPLSFAYIAGEDFHTDPNNFKNNLATGNPTAYYNNLNFIDLARNSAWASRIYDNPGVDTDGDGYAGKFRICFDSTTSRADTIWYAGDGVPDFRGALPPTPPKVWASGSVYRKDGTTIGKIRVRFNGAKSETGRDQFTMERDFEGYNLYLSRSVQVSDYSKLDSYDRLDFNKWTSAGGSWRLLDSPFTLQQLRQLYGPVGDSTWNPQTLFFDASHPYKNNPYGRSGLTDSIFYFEPMGLNHCDSTTTRIHRIYADTIEYPKPPDSFLFARWDPSVVPFPVLDSITRAKYFTDDNYLKYYEYEYSVDNLLPSVPYYINVTAFDYGSPRIGLGSLETQYMRDPIMVTFPCCFGMTGNADGDPEDAVDISDVMAIVGYLVESTPMSSCAAENDVNRDGTIDISDTLALVDYLIFGVPLPVCP